MGARPDLAKINVGTSGAKRGRGCQQQQRHELKAQMTDEEMAIDQVRVNILYRIVVPFAFWYCCGTRGTPHDFITYLLFDGDDF